MSMQSLIASMPRGVETALERSVMLVGGLGLLALAVVVVIMGIAAGADPASFAVSTDAGALL